MNILFIGGTEFVGRYMVEAALREKHRVTLFNRGKSHPELFPEAEKLVGDRDGNLDALKGKKWDVVVDSCGYIPRAVRQSAEFLKGSVGKYLFISTVSVYLDKKGMSETEESDLQPTAQIKGEEITKETYGPLKVLCEEAVQEIYRDNHLIVRPGFVIGPHDPTDRITYWVRRFATESAVLCPDASDQPMQMIDARDLGNFTIKLVDDRATGAFNATGPASLITFRQMLEACHSATGSKAEPVWADYEFLKANEVKPMQDFPLWMPPDNVPHQMLRIDLSKPKQAGLTFRPLAQSIDDILAWDKDRWNKSELKAGMKRDVEEKLLEAWQAKQV
ncbi:MAG TPA: NAD-dependent epimerase/dehydratase family protein [candidate division Zixibacteria bacterium]|nr:NAD-dependent epimerase/dehydratase family protein [candidate division Zixibacteria bacterium]